MEMLHKTEANTNIPFYVTEIDATCCWIIGYIQLLYVCAK